MPQTQMVPPTPVQTLTLRESLQSTLANQPQLYIQQQQTEISRGLKQEAASPFDFVVSGSFTQARTNTPLTSAQRALVLAEGFAPTGNVAQNTSTLNLTATKLFRNGVAVSPVYDTIRTTDNLTTTQGTNVSRVAFRVTVPLLRGRGREAIAGQERAADIEVLASQFDLQQTAEDLLTDTAQRYWNTVAALRQLEVARSSEDRARAYVDTIRTLIEADRLAKADINQAAANLDSRTADRILAEQNVIQAKQQLAIAIAMDPSRISNTAFSFDGFPDTAAQRPLVMDSALMTTYIQEALRNRADYHAAQERVEENRALLAVARNSLKPRLDLSFDTGFSGLSEGTVPAQFFNSPYRSVQGVDEIAGITYSFPIRNNLAEGQVRQAQARLEQTRLKVDDLARRISSSVITALNAVQNTGAEVHRARAAVGSFQNALEGEREKFSLGFSSVVDVLTIEDRLTVAMSLQVNAELGYALALAQVRSATGTIVQPGAGGFSVNPNVFFSLP